MSENSVFKVVVLGGQGCGKTTLLNVYQQQKFDFKVKQTDAPTDVTLKVGLQAVNKTVELWTFDLPGKESFIGLSKMYIRDANCALILYDVTSQKSIEDAE